MIGITASYANPDNWTPTDWHLPGGRRARITIVLDFGRYVGGHSLWAGDTCHEPGAGDWYGQPATGDIVDGLDTVLILQTQTRTVTLKRP